MEKEVSFTTDHCRKYVDDIEADIKVIKSCLSDPSGSTVCRGKSFLLF